MPSLLGRTVCLLVLLFCCLSSLSCASRGRSSPSRDSIQGDLSVYRTTNDQVGHEFVKTEEFLVPVGSVIVIRGLEFAPGVSTLNPVQERIVQQVFNSLEEITENTVADTNRTRVAEFKKMEFEVRGYAGQADPRESRLALAEARAKAVLDFLTYLGTPDWRLKAKGAGTEGGQTRRGAAEHGPRQGRVEFVRTR